MPIRIKLVDSVYHLRRASRDHHTYGFAGITQEYQSGMKRLLILLLWATVAFAQSNTGELRLTVKDPSGLGIESTVQLVSEANQYQETFNTDSAGTLDAKRLPFGVYTVQVQRPGFANVSASIEIHSAIPVESTIQLSVAPVNESVKVTDSDTLVDPSRTGTIERIGTSMIQDRLTSLPGRSLQDLVNTQPGWLYEGNAVLHPRGSEYQTQFVVDGIPLTDNRSPSFGTEIEADDVQSMSIYTSDIPAEYGRKMGGVVEVNTQRDTRPGLHGELVLSGGSFDTAGAYATAQYVWGKNTLGFSADGNMTSRYLNPPVPENYTNTGTTGDFAINYTRDFTDRDRLNVSVHHELSRYEIPNEQVQQAAGQMQNGDHGETMGIISYQHILSPDVVGDLHGMVRDDYGDLSSNPFSTPIIATQHNHFQEGYFKGSLSVHHGRQEWKAGIESDSIFLHENFSDMITDPSQFDPRTPPAFSFLGNRPDIEQSAFIEDFIRLGKWTVSAGLRWDHYQLLVNQNAVSPRLGVARYLKSADLVIHASYDRVFQTPDFENILLSSSPAVISLDPNVLRLPVKPSHGNYYDVGLTKGFWGKFSLDMDSFVRSVNNFADDDQLLNTAVSFPIAFLKARIYGAEGKVNIPHWGKLTGFVSYSYMVGSVYFPVTGGLFLGQDALNAQTTTSGRFWDSQDQRNTVRLRMQYQLTGRLWVAGGAEYGSGLPFDFNGTYEDALAQYGPAVVGRINFDRGRVRPNLSIDASAGVDLLKSDRLTLKLQADGENLNNRLNVIDFAGLFSGNAIAPPRSYGLRLRAAF